MVQEVKGVTRGYRELKKVKGVTGDYKRLQRVTER